MQTDWVLIARLADELRARIRGARVDDAGLLPDGRLALVLRMRGERRLLAVDLFAPTPVVALEEGELGVATEFGFIRTLARTLHGMAVGEVASRRDDRLLRISFVARSRFGVGDRLELYLELVPRFGNAVLVKDGTVVAAYREFAPSENARRVVQAGMRYDLPPLPSNPRTLPEQPPGSALEYFAQLQAHQAAQRGDERSGARRRALLKRLADRERRVRDELASLDEKRRRAGARDALREQGDAIFATLHDLAPRDRDAAKERAAELFNEYRRLAKSLPHIDARERAVAASLEAIETLRWEVERAAADDIESVEEAILSLGARRAPARSAPARRRKRAPLEYRTRNGSRIVVGRSPAENAELTFRLARPNDLWFHAQRVPGAHVILARDDRTSAPDDDVELAAALAAHHSRGKGSALVPVDYTFRKHVRKQRAAPPGLVWYTHAKTIVVEPRKEPPAERATT
jgi:predicted ribosome quality control (RQC) complex YloA/Tae2 family protein